jgi:uncharacterized membrane protein YeiH
MLDLLSGIGIIAFAISGAIVANEERYDIFGVYMLAFVTAFGGGAVRNLLIGLPVILLWSQGIYFAMAFVAVTIFVLMPRIAYAYPRLWTFFDAVGLASFSLQGALYAVQLSHPLIACITAALLTGTGGGIIRDVIAGRKPLVFQKDVYALWSAYAGFVIGLGKPSADWELLTLWTVIVTMRMLSVRYSWNLPRIGPL